MPILRTADRFTAVDLFSGCGGLTQGLKKAGFSVLAAIELDRTARETYQLNHPDVRLYEADIRAIPASSVLTAMGLKRGELDLLAGCPPCQGFSRLRTKNRRSAVKDDRNDLVDDFLRFVRVMRPKTVMLENVPALAKNRRFNHLRAQLLRMQYAIASDVLDAADYGVPQRRKRLIMLASRVHEPTMGRKVGRKPTVRDSIGGLAPPSRSRDALHKLAENRSDSVKKLIAMIPRNGGSRSDLGQQYQLDCHKRSDGFYDVYGRMAWDDVAPTITSGCHNPSKGRFLHPSRNRNITLREAAVLQGFPRRYKFNVEHGKEAVALMIGNALPPPFIAAHARSLRRGLTVKRRATGKGAQ